MTPKQIIRRVDKLKSARANHESVWQDNAHFCIPRKAYITRTRTSGERLDFHRLFDNEAIRDLQIMAAGFASHLTNPSSPWFSMTTRNRGLREIKEVKVWFNEVTEIMRDTINSSNFNSTMGEFYLESGAFGTATIFTSEDLKDKVRYTPITIKQTLIEEDSRGRVNRMYRVFNYTAQQALDRWGDKAGQTVADAIKKEDFQKNIEFIHATFPRDTFDSTKKDNINMPFADMWIEPTKEHLIFEGGFEEFPYATGRFNKEVDEVYGFGPTDNALADIKMLNQEKKILIRAAMKMVDPPFILPNSGFILPFNLNPAGANYRNDQTAKDDYQPIETKGKIPVGLEMIQDVKNDIKKAYFVDLFQAFSDITKQMTVIEVQRRIAENMVLLGPVVGRFSQEVFDPTLERTFFILQRVGMFPPIPQILDGQDLDIVYISLLAKAQRFAEIQSLQGAMNDIAGISAIIPEVLDKIDGDKAIDIIAEVRGVNPELILDDEEVAQLRERKAQVVAQQQQLEAAGAVAGIAKDASQAEKNLKT